MPSFHQNKNKVFITAFIYTLIVVFIIIGNYLSVFFITTSSNIADIKSNGFQLYMLSLSKSKIKKESSSIAKDFQSIGAGGFIWKYEDYYHNISSAYSNKNDAILVQNSIKNNKNIDSEILTITFNPITLTGSFDNNENKIISSSLNSFYTFYTNIYDIAISLDTSLYDEHYAHLEVNHTHNNLLTTITDFETYYKNNLVGNLKIIDKYLQQALSISKSLCDEKYINKTQTYSSLLKYKYLEMLSLYETISLK